MRKRYVTIAPVRCVKVPFKNGIPMSDTFTIGQEYYFVQIGNTFHHYDQEAVGTLRPAKTDIVFGRKQFVECFM